MLRNSWVLAIMVGIVAVIIVGACAQHRRAASHALEAGVGAAACAPGRVGTVAAAWSSARTLQAFSAAPLGRAWLRCPSPALPGLAWLAGKSRIHAPEPLSRVHATNGVLPYVMPLDATSV